MPPITPPQPIGQNSAGLDLSARFVQSAAVAGSPAAASETIIATLTIPAAVYVVSGIELAGYAAFTVGTSGVSANIRIRQTNVAGAIVVASGATTVAAANLAGAAVVGFDAAGVLPGQVYVLTLTVGSGAAASTVSAVYLRALVI